MSRAQHIAMLSSLIFAAGCGLYKTAPPEKEKKPVSESSGEGIFKKTTQEVGKYDPNGAFQVVSDQKIHASDPVFAALSAYGPMVEQIVITTITPSIAVFEIETGHYPNYEEFMERIIKGNNVQLPVLPYKGKYMYDEANHKILIVRHPDEVEKMK